MDFENNCLTLVIGCTGLIKSAFTAFKYSNNKTKTLIHKRHCVFCFLLQQNQSVKERIKIMAA